jgi:uncharacterized membrane protein YtjA (UPF0391 family)
MIYYTCMLLLVGVIATILEWDGVGAVAVQIAAILFVVEMVIHLATGRTVEPRDRGMPGCPAGEKPVGMFVH